ncbi:MAG: seryl-tRNA synthetase [Actinomycetota bacterium]|nr:seryl-tRNA synthetase [Actinomycetota bacterium]
MIDLKRLREDAAYREGIERKRVRDGLIDEVVALEAERAAVARAVQEHRTRQNAASKEIGKASPDERAAKIEAAAGLKSALQDQEHALSAIETRLRELALQLPNPADPSVPDGGEDDYEVVRVVGDAGPAPKLDHADFAERMGFVDADHGAQASGSRFAYVMREAVIVEFALVQWVMQRLAGRGFTPVVTPVLVRERTMEEAGFFPTDRAQVYEVDGGELFLTGTSEVPLSALHRGDVLDPEELPRRYAGFSSNFRREAGTYGKDTRGLFRVHQFDKVEMFSFANPDDSWDEHLRLLEVEESIVRDLGLPYRVINVAAGDLGAAAAKKYDIEVWLPSEGRYRESHSCSNYLDFSARRLNTRVRGVDGNRFAHTLNGTAVAVGRMLVFLFEHYQDDDGAFVVPEVLRSYTGFERVEPRK